MDVTARSFAPEHVTLTSCSLVSLHIKGSTRQMDTQGRQQGQQRGSTHQHTLI